jgi:hypothetical protein
MAIAIARFTFIGRKLHSEQLLHLPEHVFCG